MQTCYKCTGKHECFILETRIMEAKEDMPEIEDELVEENIANETAQDCEGYEEAP